MRADLKDERDVVSLTESARLFHDNISAEKEKARSPYATEFTVRTVKSSLEDKRRPRCGWYCCRKEHVSHIHAYITFTNVTRRDDEVGWTKSMNNLESDEQNFKYNS